MSIFRRKEKNIIPVLGELRIPNRMFSRLSELGEDCNIIVGAAGGYSPDSIRWFKAKDSYSMGDRDKYIIYGASWRGSSSKYSALYSIMFSGTFHEGAVIGSFRKTENSVPYPCIINIELI